MYTSPIKDVKLPIDFTLKSLNMIFSHFSSHYLLVNIERSYIFAFELYDVSLLLCKQISQKEFNS